MLSRHYSLEHADVVLSLIEKNWPAEFEATISAWSNGREQGYRICNYDNDQSVVFAQQRHSDTILVVVGSTTQFDITNNMPNDDVWDTKKEFYWDEDAANFITKWLTKIT